MLGVHEHPLGRHCFLIGKALVARSNARRVTTNATSDYLGKGRLLEVV